METGKFAYRQLRMQIESLLLLVRNKVNPDSTDIDSSVVNVEGRQEGTAKGFNPKKPGNPLYNIQFAFCDEIKAYLTGYARSGDTNTENGAAGMIKEIMLHMFQLVITFLTEAGKTMSNIRICEIDRKKIIRIGENNIKLKQVPPKIITCLDENVSIIIATWDHGK